MKPLFYFLVVPVLFLLGSCANDDDVFFNQPPAVVNSGFVNFDGLTIPLTYADMYFIEQQGNEELWGLILSENFINSGSSYTDAYLYMEFVRPVGTTLFANYATNDDFRPVLFAAYLEEVDLFNGNIENYSFFIPDEEVAFGALAARRNQQNIHSFDVELETNDGFILVAEFDGLLRY